MDFVYMTTSRIDFGKGRPISLIHLSGYRIKYLYTREEMLQQVYYHYMGLTLPQIPKNIYCSRSLK